MVAATWNSGRPLVMASVFGQILQHRTAERRSDLVAVGMGHELGQARGAAVWK